VGPLIRIKSIIGDLVGLINRLARRHGDMFTIRLPTPMPTRVAARETTLRTTPQVRHSPM
jgi:hypothetical protein